MNELTKRKKVILLGDVTDYGLYFISIIGVVLGIYIAIYWQTMPVLQIMRFNVQHKIESSEKTRSKNQ